MAVVFENNMIKINLSNTESIGSSIYNYSDLKKSKESSISSTSSYFLSTNLELSKQVLDYLNCDNDIFVVNVIKTKEYIRTLDRMLINYDEKDFHGELKDYYNYKQYYASNSSDFEIGFANASIEDGPSGRSYLRFNNDDEQVKRFRGIIIAIFSSLIVYKKKGKNYIYPVIKEEVIKMGHENVKEEFKKYMFDIKKLNENSVNQYIDVIDYTSSDAINDGILDRSIYEYNDANEVRDILESLKQNDHFNTITFKRNHINTAAVGNYISFLDYKNSNGTFVSKNDPPISKDTVNELEDKTSKLIGKLKIASGIEEKSTITKEIIRNCYELLNYYK